MHYCVNSQKESVKEDVQPYTRSGRVYNPINVSDYFLRNQIQTGAFPVYSVDYNREGMVAAGSSSGNVTIWSPENGETRVLQVNIPVNAVCYSPDGNWLAVGSGEDQGNNGSLTMEV